jgi:site-specific recombinase XerD
MVVTGYDSSIGRSLFHKTAHRQYGDKKRRELMKKTDHFTEDEITAMLNVVKGTSDEPLLRVALDTGAKVHGISNIWLSQLNFDRVIMVEVYDKGKDSRFVRLSPEAGALMHRAYWESWYRWKNTKRQRDKERLNFRLFSVSRISFDERGWNDGRKRFKPISARTLNRKIKSWAKDAGITRRVDWMMIKHTTVIRLLKLGRTWDEIKEVVGDQVSSLELMYSDFKPDVDKLVAMQQDLQNLEDLTVEWKI